jgi:SAM-dependent methyltransferase
MNMHESYILEVGCGNGRDALYFAHEGYNTLACDICEKSIDVLKSKHEKSNDVLPKKPCFFAADFCQLEDSNEYLNGGKSLMFIYSRFTLHSVTESQATNFLRFAFHALSCGGYLAIEARSVNDSLYGKGIAVDGEKDAYMGETTHADAHFRRFIRIENLVSELKYLGFEITHEEERSGLSIHKDDDPVLVRVLAFKK